MSIKVSILLPVYKGSAWLGEALGSILSQSFSAFEILVSDDNDPKNVAEIKRTYKLIESFKDERIRYYKTEKNLGYAMNLKSLFNKAEGEIIFLFAQDDILADGALQKTVAAFSDPQVGAVTRPYYWFDSDVKKPVREVRPYDRNKDTVLSAEDRKHLVAVINSIGQLSGLAMRRQRITEQVIDECFVAHAYPFLSILRDKKCVYLADYTVAVRISSSQSRFLSSIYEISPTESWIRMINKIFAAKRFDESRRAAVGHITKHFVGLVQLKNSAKYKHLAREIFVLIKHRPINLVDLRFWFFALGTLCVPRFILRPLVDWYKENINAKRVSTINWN